MAQQRTSPPLSIPQDTHTPTPNYLWSVSTSTRDHVDGSQRTASTFTLGSIRSPPATTRSYPTLTTALPLRLRFLAAVCRRIASTGHTSVHIGVIHRHISRLSTLHLQVGGPSKILGDHLRTSPGGAPGVAANTPMSTTPDSPTSLTEALHVGFADSNDADVMTSAYSFTCDV